LSEEHPRVSLLILNYNGKNHLENCLKSVFGIDYSNFEVRLIDNGSTDGSVEFVRKNYPQVKIVEHGVNHGFALGYNLVVDSVESEFVAFLNNDVLVEPDWLKKLIPYAKQEDVAAVTSKMLFLSDNGRINAAGGNCDVYGVGWNRGNGEVDVGQYDEAEEVFYGSGGALLIKKKVWEDVGPFDERYFLYGEDLDWCWRARLKGYKIIYVPDAKVYHYWRGSKAPMGCFLEKHWLATLLKNYSLKTLVKTLPRYLALKFLKSIWLLKNGEKEEKLAVFEALIWNLINLKDTWKKRIIIQTFRKVTDGEVQKRMYKGSFELLAGLGKFQHPFLKRYK